MRILKFTIPAMVSLQLLSTAQGQTISAPLLVVEGTNSRIDYYNNTTNTINTIYSQTNARFNAAAVDSANNNLYFMKIQNAANGTVYNELWRMDLSDGVHNDATAGVANLNYSKLTMLGQFDLGAAGSTGEVPIIGAAFHNNHLLLTRSAANQVWAIPTATLDAAAVTQRLVSTSNAFTTADMALTTLLFPNAGVSMQPGDISVAIDSASLNRLWFTGTGNGGTFTGARATSWDASSLNFTVGTTANSGASVSDLSLTTFRPGATFDPITGLAYAFENTTGNYFEIDLNTGATGALIVDGTGYAVDTGFKVFGDLTNYTSLTVIPEPSTAVLGLLSGLALFRRRR